MRKSATFAAELYEDKIEQYEKIHREIPEPIVRHLLEAGYVNLRIYREGTLLIMYTEYDEAAEVKERTIDQSAEDEWERLTEACFVKSWREVKEIFELRSHK